MGEVRTLNLTSENYLTRTEIFSDFFCANIFSLIYFIYICSKKIKMKEKAKQFAFKAHKDVNQFYGDRPYSYHLKMVAAFGEMFIHLIPEDKRDVVISACYCHDLIEDARMTYNDIKQVLGEEVAEIVYALTNEKGRTRKERANDKYYQGIRETPFASFVKCCDRIANVTNSKNEGSRMFKMYEKENPEFVEKIYDGTYKEMFNYLNELFK